MISITQLGRKQIEDIVFLARDIKKNPRVVNFMSMIGDYDMYIVIVGKDTTDLDNMKIDIKQQFSDIIDDWKEVLVSKIHKLEEYRF